eukprot:Partr_v1_DN28840_c1_g1_i4_m34003 putative ATP-binding RNA helicase involved in the biogenesis of 60S ribosomal subunits and is required for the normal formation of 25S and 5.8S rRNAs (By similarity)
MQRTTENDKYLLLFFILKLNLLKGKCIVFAKDVDQCYRVKLFLDQFAIKTCVLNSELPFNSRYHILQEFNKGVYEHIIAPDVGTKKSTSKRTQKSVVAPCPGISRGMDFKNACAVINFDLPSN